MTLSLAKIDEATTELFDQAIDFTQRIVRIPSSPGHEEDVAAEIKQEMTHLGYDEVWIDEVGNVIGKITGDNGPVVVLNGHMDHVDPGPAEGWPHPPFSGDIVEDELWGRASVDMKGPVACMIYGAALLKKNGHYPLGDIYMTVPVMEEVGGMGSQYLAQTLQADIAICGEPSRNILRRGHRGRVEMKLIFPGKSIHASIPHLGINPHYHAAAFIQHLNQLDMGHDTTLGTSTVAPTLYHTDQSSPNVTPGQVILTLDWRNVPSETPETIVNKVKALLQKALGPEIADQILVEVPNSQFTTYTGHSQAYPSIFPGFLLDPEHPGLKACQRILSEITQTSAPVDIWRFATDGGHLMEVGIPTVGFGPGDERLAHTNQERISLPQMRQAVMAYAAFIPAMAQAIQIQEA